MTGEDQKIYRNVFDKYRHRQDENIRTALPHPMWHAWANCGFGLGLIVALSFIAGLNVFMPDEIVPDI